MAAAERGETGFLKRETEALHDDLGSGGIGADIDADMANDSEEAEQYERTAQEFKTLLDAGSLIGASLLNRSSSESSHREEADKSID